MRRREVIALCAGLGYWPRRANRLVAVPAGGVMRITTELLLIGGLWLAVALFVVTVLIGWG